MSLTLLTALSACGGDSAKQPREPTPNPTKDIGATSSVTSLSQATSAPSLVLASATPLVVGEQALVTRVIDGDTIEVDRTLDGPATVRYIGINAPEMGASGLAIDCFGLEAKARNEALVQGQTVVLQKDISETDSSGRLLRYVYLEDGRLVNEVLITEGFARTARSSPDVKYTERFDAAQKQAIDAGRGLWGPACEPTVEPFAQQGPPNTPQAPEAQPTKAPTSEPLGPGCHPAYRGGTDVETGGCIRIGAGEYDCAGFGGDGPRYVEGPVEVVGSDLFGLDHNGNGIGCESPEDDWESGVCYPFYVPVCIPPPPPDLDCEDIPYRDFAVIGPDPHGFDDDGNGIGCES